MYIKKESEKEREREREREYKEGNQTNCKREIIKRHTDRERWEKDRQGK